MKIFDEPHFGIVNFDNGIFVGEEDGNVILSVELDLYDEECRRCLERAGIPEKINRPLEEIVSNDYWDYAFYAYANFIEQPDGNVVLNEFYFEDFNGQFEQYYYPIPLEEWDKDMLTLVINIDLEDRYDFCIRDLIDGSTNDLPIEMVPLYTEERELKGLKKKINSFIKYAKSKASVDETGLTIEERARKSCCFAAEINKEFDHYLVEVKRK